MSSAKKQSSNASAIRICQQDIVKHDLHVKAFVQDIRECSGPIAVLTTLNLQVSEHMRAMKAAVEELQRIAHEQDLERDKLTILGEVEKYRKQITSNQTALRKANLMCQNELDRRNRDVLFLRDSDPKPEVRARADKEGLARQSSNVTDSLFALNSMISMQVKHSEETLGTLVSSSSNITDTSEELKNMGGIIKQSRKLLSKYGRREFTDRILIVLAVIFFFICVWYVVRKRMF